MISLFFFFNDTATTEIYTLSLHDALPISPGRLSDLDALGLLVVHSVPHDDLQQAILEAGADLAPIYAFGQLQDRKSTRLNSSHANISYAVFCLKKKKKIIDKHSIKYTHRI